MSLKERFSFTQSFQSDLFFPVCIENQQLGFIRKDYLSLLEQLEGWQFSVLPSGESLISVPAQNFEELTTFFSSFGELCLKSLPSFSLRKEFFPVQFYWGAPVLGRIDRALLPYFGLPAFGVHLNAFVRKKESLFLWVAKRALNKKAEPGKLDHLVAGGQPEGLGLLENLKKEAQEEAGLQARFFETVTPVGALSYLCPWQEGVRQDSCYCFDLELPEDFHPVNEDGEVASFSLLPVEEVYTILRTTDRFKFNSAVVIIDFLRRHRVPCFEKDPDYDWVCQHLNFRSV